MTQLPLDLGHRPALGRSDFLVAPSNAAAIGWLDRWPDWPGPALVVGDVLNEFREIRRHPNVVALFLRSACIRFQEVIGPAEKNSASTLGALAEMWEMTRLLETTTRFYAD